MVNVPFTTYAFPSTGTTTARTQPARNAQYIMLEDFGGVGDSATDNVAAINAAAAALGTQPVTVYLDPTKGYAFNSSFSLPIAWTIDGRVGAVAAPLPGYNSWCSATAKAGNFVQFFKNPLNGESIVLNGTTVTFVTGAPVGNQVQIAANMNTTVTNLTTFLNASADTQIAKCTYVTGNWTTAQLQTGGTDFAIVEITFDTAGTGGNSYTLVTNSLGVPNMKVKTTPAVRGAEQFLQNTTNSVTLLYGGSPTLGGSIILNSGAQIKIRRHSSVRNCVIFNGSTPSTYAGPVNVLANVTNFSGTALITDTAFSAFIPECQFRNLMVVGFDQAMDFTQFSRGVISDIKLDCTHGVKVTQTFDIFDTCLVRANQYYDQGFNQLFVDTTYRMGVFIRVSEGASAPTIRETFGYGHAIKYLIGNEFSPMLTAAAGDGPGSPTTTPALLDFTITAAGSGYANGAAVTLSQSKGEVLYVTTNAGAVTGITVLDPGTWNGTEAVPTITAIAGGIGATATVQFIKAIGFSTYGAGVGNLSFVSPTMPIQTYPFKLEGTGASHGIVNMSVSTSGGAGKEISTGAATVCYVSGIPTAGTPQSGLLMGRESGNIPMGIFRGTGSPEGVVVSGPGGLYLNISGGAGTTLYVKQTGNGNTGWVGK